MQLQALRPKHGVDLLEAHSLIRGSGWRAVLPDALPEPVLLGLAHDFKLIECGLAGELKEQEDDASSLATAIYIITKLLTQHSGRGEDAADVSVSESGLVRAIQYYQWSIEREISSRILGRSSTTQIDSFLDSLWRSARD